MDWCPCLRLSGSPTDALEWDINISFLLHPPASLSTASLGSSPLSSLRPLLSAALSSFSLPGRATAFTLLATRRFSPNRLVVVVLLFLLISSSLSSLCLSVSLSCLSLYLPVSLYLRVSLAVRVLLSVSVPLAVSVSLSPCLSYLRFQFLTRAPSFVRYPCITPVGMTSRTHTHSNLESE